MRAIFQKHQRSSLEAEWAMDQGKQEKNGLMGIHFRISADLSWPCLVTMVTVQILRQAFKAGSPHLGLIHVLDQTWGQMAQQHDYRWFSLEHTVFNSNMFDMGSGMCVFPYGLW